MVNSQDVPVFHITPARSDLNLGKSANELIRGLPDNSWIVYRDIDTLPLCHVDFIRQCEEIARDGSYQLVGGICNRLGLSWQLHNGKISDNPNIDHHMEIAKDRVEKYGSKVEPAPQEIAGFLLIFSKHLWNEVGGFPEGKLLYGNQFWDNIFYERAKENGFSIGICQGIYLWHSYRWNKNPRSKEGKAHLITKK